MLSRSYFHILYISIRSLLLFSSCVFTRIHLMLGILAKSLVHFLLNRFRNSSPLQIAIHSPPATYHIKLVATLQLLLSSLHTHLTFSAVVLPIFPIFGFIGFIRHCLDLDIFCRIVSCVCS